MTVYFTSNKFDDNYVRGGDAGLIFVKGPHMIAKNNLFRRSGQLDTFYYTKNEPSQERKYKSRIVNEVEDFYSTT